MCAPFIGPVSIAEYLPSGQIEQVYCDGENYNGARPCHYEWVKALRDADNKELLIILGASHTDLYDGGKNGAIPFDKLEAFFAEHLK